MTQFPESHVYKLKWNSHVQSLQDVFQDLLLKETFTDVTLSFEDGTMKAHKAMLSSCSSYFSKIFRECERKHSMVIMCGVTKSEMTAILKFVYSGEISVSEDEIQGVLNSAKMLEIRGLSDTGKTPDSFQRDAGSPRLSFNVSSQNGCEPNAPITANQPRKVATPRPRKRPPMVHQTGPQSLGSGVDANISPRLDSVGTPEASQRKTFRKPAPSPIKRMRPNDCATDLSMMEESIDSGKDEGSPFYPEVSLSDAPECDGPQLESPLRVRKDLLGDSDLGASISPISVDAIERSSSATTLSTLDEDIKREAGENYPFNVLDESGTGNSISAICPFCLKDCKRTAELRAHIRAHTGEKPFQCDICGAPFARSAHLKRHRRVHTGERPFECPRCGKTFSRQDKLKLHVDRHIYKEGGCVPIPKAEREAMAALKMKEEGGIKKYGKKNKELSANGRSPDAPVASGPKQDLPILPAPSNGLSVPVSVPFGDVSYLSLLSVPPRQMINADFSAAFIRSAVHEQALRQLFQTATQQPRDLPVPIRPSMMLNKPRPGLPTSTEGLVNYVQQLGECTIKSVDGSN